jgi:general secretion pathway protein J
MKGFSLIEMLVALGVFAIVSAMVTLLLGQSLRTQDSVSVANERVAEVQRLRALLRADLAHAVDRAPRDDAGRREPPLLLSANRLQIVRADSAGVVTVEYRVDNGALLRRQRAQPDGAAWQGEMTLARGLSNARFSALGDGKQPQAIALRYESADFGALEHRFLLGGVR